MIAELAGRQRGVVSYAQLRGAGLSKGAIARRIEAGRLHRVHRGVYAVGHRGLAAEGRWMAAILACGNDVSRSGRAGDTASVLGRWGTVLSLRSAGSLWRLLPSMDGPVDVTIAGIGGRERRDGIHVHRSRTLTPGWVTSHRGIPVTTPARTISDLCRAARTRGCPASVAPRELRRAIRQAEVLGLPTGVEGLAERTRSDLERAFLRLCRRNRLPEPEVNVRIGRSRVDFAWRHRRLVVETDGYRYHRGRAAFEDDRARDLRLRALGYDVIRLTGRQLDDEPERCLEIVRRRLAQPF